MSKKSKVARFAIWAAVIPLLMVGSVIGALWMPQTLDSVREPVIEVINESLEGTVEIGALEGTVLSDIVVKDVVLRAPDGSRVAHLPEARASVALSDLLGRGVTVDVEASNAYLFVRRDEAGDINLLSALPAESDEPSLPLPVWIDLKIALTESVVVWRDESAPSTPDDPLASLNADADVETSKAAALRVEAPVEPPRTAPRNVVLTDVATQVRVLLTTDQRTTVEVQQTSARAASPTITASRDLTLDRLVLEVAPDGLLDVTATSIDVAKWASVDELALRLPENIEDIAVRTKATLTSSLLTAVAPEIGSRSGIGVEASVAARGEKTGVLADLTIGDEVVNLNAAVGGWLEPGPDTTWSATVRTKDFAVAEQFASAHPLMSLSGVVSVDGQGIDPKTVKARIRAGLEDVEVDRFKVDALSVRGSLTEMTGTVDELVLSTPYANATAAASLDPDGKFSVEATAQSAELVSKVAAILFEQKVDSRADIKLQASGQVDLSREEPLEILRTVDASASWDVASFVAEDLRIERSSGSVELKADNTKPRAELNIKGRANGKNVRAQGLRLAGLSAQLDADVRADVADPKPMDIAKALRARLDLDVDGLIAEGALVRDVDVLAQIKPGSKASTYDVRGSASRLAASDLKVRDIAAKLSGTLTMGAVPEWPAALRAFTVKGTASALGVDSAGDAASSLNATIDIGGPLSDLRGAVLADTTGLTVGGYAFEQLSAKVDFVGDRVFEVDADGTQKDRKPAQVGVYARGQYNRELTDFRLLELRFDGAGDAWAISDGFAVDTARGTLAFNDVTLTHADQRVFINGRFRQGVDQDVKATVENLQISSIARDFGIEGLETIRGRVDLEAEVAGTAREPTATFDVRLSDLYVDEYGPFTLAARGRYGELELIVETMEVDGYGVRLLQGNAQLPVRVTTTGEFEVLQGEDIDASFETPEFNPRKLAGAAPVLAEWDVSGTVGMTTRLRGSLLKPNLSFEVETDKLVARPAIDAERVKVGPLESKLTVRYSDPGNENGGFEAGLNATIADQPPLMMLARVQADVAKWLRMQLSGEVVDWEENLQAAPWRFVGQAKQFDLRQVRIGPLREADVEGVLDLAIIGDGTLAQPRANFEIGLDDFGYERYRDVYFDADVGVERDRLQLKKARLEWDGDEILVASGTVPAPFEAVFGDKPLGFLPIDFEAKLQPMTLSKLSAIDYSFASLTGKVQGSIKLGGNLGRPTASARIAMDDISFADGSKGGIAMNASLTEDDLASGGLVWTREGKPSLTGDIELPIDINIVRIAGGETPDLSNPVKASLKGADVPLASLLPQRFFDDIVKRVKGKLSADLKMAGSLLKPTFDGRLRVQNGEMTLSEYSRDFKNMQFDLTAKPDGRMRLNDLHVEGERGYIDAQGDLAVDGWSPGVVDGKVEVREFGTAGFADLAMFVWADVVLDGDFSAQPPTAKATIGALEVVVPDSSDLTTHPTSLDTDIVVVRTKKDREALFPVEGNIEPVSTEPYAAIAVEIESGGRVRHPLAQVEVKGKFDLSLSDAGPTLRGEVQTQRGTAQFLGKKFQIQQGIVTFTGQDPPDPRLQLEAVYSLDRNITRDIGQPTSGEPRAIVRVTGRATDPRIRFLSDPAMTEADVIYVLLTNRPPGQGEVGETGLATGAASGLLTGLIADTPVGQVFDVRVEAEQGFSDATIEVGRYITPEIFISIDFKSSARPDENTSELNIEYRFLPRWIFEFEAGDRGTGEANVFWDIY